MRACVPDNSWSSRHWPPTWSDCAILPCASQGRSNGRSAAVLSHWARRGMAGHQCWSLLGRTLRNRWSRSLQPYRHSRLAVATFGGNTLASAFGLWTIASKVWPIAPVTNNAAHSKTAGWLLSRTKRWQVQQRLEARQSVLAIQPGARQKLQSPLYLCMYGLDNIRWEHTDGHIW